MADDPTSTNIDITNNLKEQNRLVAEQNRFLGQQVDLSRQLNALIGARANVMENASKSSAEAMAAAAEATAKSADEQAGAFGRASTAAGGFRGTLQSLTENEWFKTIVDGVETASAEIESLTKTAREALTQIKEADEAIRDAFGDISEGVSANIIQMSQEFERLGDLAGVSMGQTYSIFGAFGEGIVAQRKFFQETAAGFGNLVNTIEIGSKKYQEAAIALRKGAGLSADEIGVLGVRSKATGKSIDETLGSLNERIISISKSSGIGAKFIGKTVGDMLKDLGKFGSFTDEELTKMAATLNKVGLEAKDLQGIIDGFDNFDSAAKNAAKLNQAFGIQLDSYKLMMEEDPTKRLAMIQNAFKATGQNITDLSRVQRNYLAETSGISVDKLDAAFGKTAEGAANAGAAIEDAAATQMTQDEAFAAMAANIQRIITPLGEMSSAMKAAFEGFGKGVIFGEAGEELFKYSESLQDIAQAASDTGKAVSESLAPIAGLLTPGTAGTTADIIDSINKNLVPPIKEAFDPVIVTTIDSFEAAMETVWEKAGTSLESLKPKFKELIPELNFDTGNFDPMIKGAEDAFGEISNIFGKGLTIGSDVDAATQTTSFFDSVKSTAIEQIRGLTESALNELAPGMGPGLAGYFFGSAGVQATQQAAGAIPIPLPPTPPTPPPAPPALPAPSAPPEPATAAAVANTSQAGIQDSAIVTALATLLATAAKEIIDSNSATNNTSMVAVDALKEQTDAMAAIATTPTEPAEIVLPPPPPPAGPTVATASPEPVAIDTNFDKITEELRNLQGTGATVINTDLYIDGGLLRQYLIGKGTGVFKVTT